MERENRRMSQSKPGYQGREKQERCRAGEKEQNRGENLKWPGTLSSALKSLFMSKLMSCLDYERHAGGKEEKKDGRGRKKVRDGSSKIKEEKTRQRGIGGKEVGDRGR